MNRRGKTKEGFLHVKQPSRFGKAWKRKWVVIRPNATKGSEQASILLELYLEKGAVNKTVTSLLLEGITHIKRVISKSQPRAFEFVKGSVVALTLAGDSETETQEWIEIFRKLLLPASQTKELATLQECGTDVIRVTVVPNKDSERLNLSGTYLAGVARLTVALHNAITGEKVIEWDLRHMKRFMLPSKGPQQDLEKIACLQISNRSPQGEGEYLFHSQNAKPLVEAICERLNKAIITVKERRSRTSSMLFEIPPKELEQLAKAIQEGGDPGFVMVSAEGSLEDETFEEDGEKKENGEAKTNGDGEAKTNGDGEAKTNGDGEAKTNGDAEVKTNGENKDNHVDESTAEEAKLENGESTEEKIENGQSEEVKTGVEDAAKETTADENSTNGGATEAVQENGFSENVDNDSPKGGADETPEAENTARVEGDDGVAVSKESTDNVVEEVAQSEKPSDELNETVEDTKDKENEQPIECSPVNDVSAEDSASAAPIETQDFAAGPIDAEDESVELAEGATGVQPRMPPGFEEPQQESEATESKDATEQMDERTVETGDSVVCSSELNGEEIEVEPQNKSSAEDSNQVEISTDTQDIETESASVDESSAAGEQSVTTSEDTQQEVVATEDTKPSEECSPESPKLTDESTEEVVVTAEPVQSNSGEAAETPAPEETSATENETQDKKEKVPDVKSSPAEQTLDGPSEKINDVPENKTPAQSDSGESGVTPSTEETSATEKGTQDQNEKIPDVESSPAELTPDVPSEQIDDVPENKTPAQSDSVEAGETPATEETSAAENETQNQNEKVPDVKSSSAEQTPDAPSEQMDDVPEIKTPTSDEVAQDDTPVASSESMEPVEPAIVEDRKPSAPSEPVNLVGYVEPVIVDERRQSQEENEESNDKNDGEEDTAM